MTQAEIDAYISHNYIAKSDSEIAAALGKHRTTIMYHRNRLGLSKSKGGDKGAGSICWACANAYVDKCLWIDKKVEVWSKAQTKKLRQDKRYVEVVRVRSCDLFMEEG